MSLDVWLTLASAPHVDRGSGIFIRENGETREITREEWDRRYPDREPIAVCIADDAREVYSANITHNLTKMADAAGVYQACWAPEEIGATHARQLIEPLRAGLALLNTSPEYFKQFNPDNGWGTYDGLCRFVANYLEACERWPDAEISVSV